MKALRSLMGIKNLKVVSGTEPGRAGVRQRGGHGGKTQSGQLRAGFGEA